MTDITAIFEIKGYVLGVKFKIQKGGEKKMYYLTGLLGLVAIAAPYFLNYSSNLTALWTSLIFGAVLVVVSVLEGLAQDKESWEYWVAGIAGMAAILAPFTLGFTALAEALWTLLVVGMITIIAAVARLFQGEPKTRLGY